MTVEPEEFTDEQMEAMEEHLLNSTAVECGFLVGTVTNSETGECCVTLIPESGGSLSNIFYVVPLDLAEAMCVGIIATVQRIKSANDEGTMQ